MKLFLVSFLLTAVASVEGDGVGTFAVKGKTPFLNSIVPSSPVKRGKMGPKGSKGEKGDSGVDLSSRVGVLEERVADLGELRGAMSKINLTVTTQCTKVIGSCCVFYILF